MATQEVVFNTQAEAEAQQDLDHICNVNCKKMEDYNADWEAITTRWAVPVERLDGKWAYSICPDQDYAGMTVEEKDPANYPVVDDGMGGEEEDLIVIVDDEGE